MWTSMEALPSFNHVNFKQEDLFISPLKKHCRGESAVLSEQKQRARVQPFSPSLLQPLTFENKSRHMLFVFVYVSL